MAKLLKILGRIVGGMIEWILILFILFAFIIRTSAVQTYIAKEAAAYLSEELNATVKIDQVAVIFFDQVALDGVLIEDQQGDTLISANRIIVDLDNINLKKQSYTISEAKIRKAFIHIQRSKENVFNHAFIKEYFQQEKKEKSKVKFLLRYAEISDSKFKYDDHRKESRTSGIDYFHLSTKGVNGTISNLRFQEDTIHATIQGFSAIEKCGFELQCLSTNAKVSPKGVLLKNMEIKSKDSWIRASKFNMLSDSYNGFKYFVDSVKFDGKIDESNVSLKEVAYFAYALEGMDDHVRLKTEISNKVAKLRLKNFDLRYKENTFIQGRFELDDYRKLPQGFYHERLDDIYIDLSELKQLKLPKSSPSRYITLSPEIERLKFIEGDKIYIDGNYLDFVLAANTFKTALGSAQLNNGLQFKQHDEHASYTFKNSNEESPNYFDFTVHEFELGNYLNNSDLGIIDGSFKLAGEIYSSSDIRFDKIAGNINKFEYLNYPYSEITIREGEFKHNRFKGRVEVNDPYLTLVYDGSVDFSNKHKMDFEVFIRKSDLDRLNLSDLNSHLVSNMKVNLSGKNLNSYTGFIEFDAFDYTVDDQTFHMDDFKLTIERGLEDKFSITGSAGTAEIAGKFKTDQLINNFHYQFSQIFPSLYGDRAANYSTDAIDYFTYKAEFITPNNLVQLFYPELEIAPHTRINGNYNGSESMFKLNVYSDSIRYKEMKFDSLSLEQILNKNQILADYRVKNFQYSDSLQFQDVYFKTYGGNDNLQHRLSWEEKTTRPSEFSWDTQLHDSDHYGFVLNPSHFFIKDHQWDISHSSSLLVKGDTINVSNFELVRNNQKILIDGKISNQDSHKLNFDVTNLELSEISPFISSDYPMSGIINLDGHISNPFNSLGYEGDGKLTNFIVNNQNVGDITVNSYWNKFKQAITTTGNLRYIEEKTFDFAGDYYLFEEEDNLDFDLNFDYTNLQFTNAFLDPDVVSEIRGFINGHLDLTGDLNQPILDGKVSLTSGSAYVDLLGVHFGVDGPIEVDQYGFYINGIPIFDEDANTGLLIGSVFHDNFKNFNFDLQFDLEPQVVNNTPLFGNSEFSRFLVMNLPYDHDALYYGKGYVTGTANIFGYTDNLEINVDFKTAQGTTLNIPMFGVGEIEEKDFVTFKQKEIDTLIEIEPPLFDLSGVYVDLNFEATPAANINIIFNEEIGDVISATGSGDISITMDNLGDMRMEGTYEVAQGVYNFAMNPVSGSPIAVKQSFTIQPGGSISWSGDPYDAKLDLKTYYKLNANLSEISGDNGLGSNGGAHQTILPYLNLSGTMVEPQIEFDIQAPNADDFGKTLIDRITSDQDELSRQFFSLMLARRFQPIAGIGGANGSAALDLLTNQVNAMLSRISEEYTLKVGIDNDMISGDNTYEFGISKGFLNDRLIFSGSFGVENYGEEEVDDNGNVSTGQLIGDLNLEYVINESGTFRVNIFNESTDKTIIQESGEGDFTQGAGLSYKEDFESFDDFKVVQFVLDLFRKKEKKRYIKNSNKKQRPVPERDILKPKDETTP